MAGGKEDSSEQAKERDERTAEMPASLGKLSRAEQEAALDALASALNEVPSEVVEAYAELGRRPGAVGLDEHGRLVRVPPEGGPPVIITRGATDLA